MNIQNDKIFDKAEDAKQAVAAIADLPADVRTFVDAEIDRIGVVLPADHKLRVMVAVHDQQTLVHVHTYFAPVQPHA